MAGVAEAWSWTWYQGSDQHMPHKEISDNLLIEGQQGDFGSPGQTSIWAILLHVVVEMVVLAALSHAVGGSIAWPWGIG